MKLFILFALLGLSKCGVIEGGILRKTSDSIIQNELEDISDGIILNIPDEISEGVILGLPESASDSLKENKAEETFDKILQGESVGLHENAEDTLDTASESDDSCPTEEEEDADASERSMAHLMPMRNSDLNRNIAQIHINRGENNAPYQIIPARHIPQSHINTLDTASDTDDSGPTEEEEDADAAGPSISHLMPMRNSDLNRNIAQSHINRGGNNAPYQLNPARHIPQSHINLRRHIAQNRLEMSPDMPSSRHWCMLCRCCDPSRGSSIILSQYNRGRHIPRSYINQGRNIGHSQISRDLHIPQSHINQGRHWCMICQCCDTSRGSKIAWHQYGNIPPGVILTRKAILL